MIVAYRDTRYPRHFMFTLGGSEIMISLWCSANDGADANARKFFCIADLCYDEISAPEFREHLDNFGVSCEEVIAELLSAVEKGA